MANLSTGQIFYTVIARPQRGRSNPVFGWLSGLLRQDSVLPRNDENRQFSSAVENLAGVEMANSKNGLFVKSVLNNKYKLRDLWVKDPAGSEDEDSLFLVIPAKAGIQRNVKIHMPSILKKLFFIKCLMDPRFRGDDNRVIGYLRLALLTFLIPMEDRQLLWT